VGMIATKVNGTTQRMIIAPASQPIPAPSNQWYAAQNVLDHRLTYLPARRSSRPNGTKLTGPPPPTVAK
jgi:hypothetical protein